MYDNDKWASWWFLGGSVFVYTKIWLGVYCVLYKSMNFSKSGWIEYDVWLTLVMNVTGCPRAYYFHSIQYETPCR